jgi:uncharacterized SAM-dependent methyltransferase
VDLSSSLATEALAIARKELAVSGSPIITDFFEPLPSVKPNCLLGIMGGTIGNFETYDGPKSLQTRLAQIFTNYRNAVSGNSSFLVSYDANTNGDEIIACYASDNFNYLIRSCIDRAIDTSSFDYDVVWSPHNYQLAIGLRSKRDQIVHFVGQQFAIEKNEFLPVLNSYRFPVVFVQDAAKLAGWQHKNTWTATGRVHYSLFKA